ncbi:CAP domain-containing protein [Crepidotus variabilis]|uniref:CAP domain-containing protein n=1 Tax=Crepidotus variabilis TaxID=179855 RepID=A0A9P6EJB0_9AGAR|nr:CAP domain-containing protein [Crepidotus variabilis]
MRFQLPALLSTIFAFSTALPHDNVDGLTLFSDQSLPESGQVVSTPLQFGNDGEEIFAIDVDGLDGDGDNVGAAIFEEWKATVVRTHNEYRKHYGAPPVTWSDALYPGTNQWASQCKFEHSNGQGKYGENLAAGTGNSYGYVDGLKSWMDEASKYDYNHPGFSSGTGHFTQVVWKSSNQVACAIANCRAGTIFGQASKNIVCRYTPAGNFAGRYPENVGRRQ